MTIEEIIVEFHGLANGGFLTSHAQLALIEAVTLLERAKQLEERLEMHISTCSPELVWPEDDILKFLKTGEEW